MDYENMAANESQPFFEDLEKGLENLRMLEISEAIHDLDSRLTDLENALHLDKNRKQESFRSRGIECEY